MNSDLETRLRNADPARNHPLDTDSEQVLAQIIATPTDLAPVHHADAVPSAPPVRRARFSRVPRMAWAVAAVAAVLIGVLAIGIPWLNAPRAVAGIVPALRATPTGQAQQEVLSELLQKAQATKDPHGFDERTYRIKDLREGAMPQEVVTNEATTAFSPVSEFDIHTIRRPDGQYERTATNQGIFSARSGERIAGINFETGKRIPPGTVTTAVVPPEEMRYYFEVPDTPRAIDTKTRSRSTDGSAMFTGNAEVALFEVLGDAMGTWNPSQVQSAAVLKLLLHRSDIAFDGKTTDRMGRPGLMFSIEGSYAPGYDQDDRYTYRYSFIFDTATGHLNAYEQVAGQDIDYFVPGGTLNSVTVAAP